MDNPTPLFNVEKALVSVGGMADLLQEVAQMFEAEAVEQLENAERAVNTKNAALLVLSSHTIKGAAAALGGERVREIAAKIEYDARENILEHAVEDLVALKNEIADLQTAITDYLANDG